MRIESTGAITFAAAAADSGEGDALPRFWMVANTGKPMWAGDGRGGAVRVVIDLAGAQFMSQRLPIRLQHDPLLGIGHTESVSVEGGQIVASGIISRDTDSAREVVASSRAGFPWQASVGTEIIKAETLKRGQSAEVNGMTVEGPIVIARESITKEISFVDVGADTATSAIAAKHAPEVPAESEQSMQDLLALVASAPQHAKLVHDMHAEGKDAEEIKAAIQAADTAARIEAAESRATAAEAALEEAAGKLADAEAKAIEASAEVESLKARVKELEAFSNTGKDPGSDHSKKGEIECSGEEFMKMSPLEQSAFFAKGGKLIKETV